MRLEPIAPKDLTSAQMVKKVRLVDTVDGKFTTVEDVGCCAVFFAGFPFNALTGQSFVERRGSFMQ
jgi:3-hydroxybutyrate dehydrogenase